MKLPKSQSSDARTWCELTGDKPGGCGGMVLVAAHEASAGQPSMLRCPCKLLFPLGLSPIRWWPRDVDLAMLRARSVQVQRVLGGGSAGLVLGSAATLSDFCGVAAAALLQHPVLSAAQSLRELYGSAQPQLSEKQRDVLARQLTIRLTAGIRQSEVHHLVSAAEIQEWGERFVSVPGRLGIVIVDQDEFSFLSKSSKRLENFSALIRRMEVQDMPLVLVSAAPLVGDSEGGQVRREGGRSVSGPPSEVPRESYRDDQQRLRFRSSKLKERVARVQAFADILDPDDFDLLLGRLAAGAEILKSGGTGGL